MIARYLLALGILLVCAGALELAMPLRAFALWRRWASSRFFFLHGLVLIAGGLPLAIYDGPLSAIIFVLGIMAALTGPFVLIYPEKFRAMFMSAAEELGVRTIRNMVYAEGGLRIAAGAVCAAAYFLGRAS